MGFYRRLPRPLLGNDGSDKYKEIIRASLTAIIPERDNHSVRNRNRGRGTPIPINKVMAQLGASYAYRPQVDRIGKGGTSKSFSSVRAFSTESSPFIKSVPATWIRFKDWSFSVNAAPNLGYLGGNATVVPTYSNPIAKNGDALIVDLQLSNEFVQIPFKNTDIDNDGEVTVIVKMKAKNAASNEGMISLFSGMYFLKRPSDWQLTSMVSANFGVSDLNTHVFIIRLKPGIDNSSVEIDFVDNNNPAMLLTGSHDISTYTFAYLGAIRNTGNLPADIEVEEIAIYTDGTYDDSNYESIKKYFGF